ncbi:hypothetical protein MIR68_007462 [Amoeboaphelidium protococcarum]|nr:hypothetical protein MIR68_007462 [Amoeboaphelidium protococcarum]
MKSTLIAVTLLAAVARAAPTYPYDGAYPQDLQDDQGFNDDSDLQYGAPQQNQPDVDASTPYNSFKERRTQSSGQLQQFGAAQPEEQQYYAHNPLARQSYDDAYPQDYQRQQPALRQHSNGGLTYKHPSLPRNFVPPQQQQQQPQHQQQLQQQYSSVPASNSAPAQQFKQQQGVTKDPYDAAEESESEDFEFQDAQQQAPAPQQGSQASQAAVTGGAAAGGVSVAGASAGTAGAVPVQQPPQQQEGSSNFNKAFKAWCPGLAKTPKAYIAAAISKAGSIFAACQSDADVQQPQQPSAGASATTEQRSADPAAQQSAPSSSGQAPQEPAKKGFLANLFKW